MLVQAFHGDIHVMIWPEWIEWRGVRFAARFTATCSYHEPLQQMGYTDNQILEAAQPFIEMRLQGSEEMLRRMATARLSRMRPTTTELLWPEIFHFSNRVLLAGTALISLGLFGRRAYLLARWRRRLTRRQCTWCGYQLDYETRSPVCPECGR